MALQDFRQLVDVGTWGHVGVELRAVNAAEQYPRPIAINVSSLHLELHESEAGQLLDAIAGALRILADGRGAEGVSDTPGRV